MLKFREIEYQRDLTEAVNLIRKGLDANYKEEFFQWKHLENPFGRSFGLVATDNEKIIGLRMFMFWKFYNAREDRTLTALRPVDTVVDKNYRGEGLFKKLTLKGLKECSEKYDIIFNTPNENSLPGYLKMGWNEVKTGDFKIGFVKPRLFGENLNFKKAEKEGFLNNEGWETLKNKNYFDWRYQDSKYKTANYKEAFLIYSITNIKGISQIVIQEGGGGKKELKKLLTHVAAKEKAFLVYFYANRYLNELLGFTLKRKKSVVVVKNDIWEISDNFSFSLGDLEGKL